MRLLVRQVTDVLRRHEVIDAATAAALHSVGRSPTLPDVMRGWFELQPAMDIEMLGEVLGWAARPYLQRTAEVLQQRVSLERWIAPRVPGLRRRTRVLGDHHQRRSPAGVRPLPRALGASARSPARTAATTIARRIKSMATPDGMYRVMICSPCGRYIKALDTRKATRPLLPYVDLIATLPLDAAVMQSHRLNATAAAAVLLLLRCCCGCWKSPSSSALVRVAIQLNR